MHRRRITITLKDELIKKLDQITDGAKIRNRSHAIEYILDKNFAADTTQVLILAGGKGIKLRPFTYEMPKSLLPIKNKPLLEHTINLLKKHELTDILISIGYLGDKIKDYFGDGSKFGVKIDYIKTKKQQGTQFPILEAKDMIHSKNFLVIYGDELADIDLKDLLDFHKNHKSLATIALSSVEKSNVWGVANLRGNKILEFKEKPKTKKTTSHLVNAGIFVFSQDIFKYISEKPGLLETEVFPRLAQENKLYGYPFEGQWFDVGTPETYEEAVKKW